MNRRYTLLTHLSVITAVYKGSPRGSPPALLRSYDSRKEPPPEFDCKIWQAGRATCAVGLAFKPIQIGQSVFHDEGTGTFNPAPDALDEAVINEWPGREVGVFVSVGTGRRPRGSDANQHLWYEGFMGDYADARRKLIAKIEGCERIHEYMLREHLGKRNVSIDNYYRLNVEIGVGEFGMNEWNRLGDISTGTRRYMSKEAEQKMIQGITSKLGKIHRQKLRYERAAQGIPELVKTSSSTIELPLAVELPGDMPLSSPVPRTPPSRSSFESGERDSLHIRNGQSPRSSNERERTRPSSGYSNHSPPRSDRYGAPPSASAPTLRPEDADRFTVNAPTPAQYRVAEDAEKIAIMSLDEQPRPGPSRQAAPAPTRIEPPPLPPKTPLPENQQGGNRRSMGPIPPYPLDDEAPPPPVNMARKPDYRGR